MYRSGGQSEDPFDEADSGRTLTDDAVDPFVALLTNEKVTADKVGPHYNLLAEFPYLGRRTAPLGRRIALLSLSVLELCRIALLI